MTKAIAVSIAALSLAACGGGDGRTPAPLPAIETSPISPPPPPPPPVATCASQPSDAERWPAWNPGTTYASAVANAMRAYRDEGHDWRMYYQPGGYIANGEYVTIQGFATLGPEVRLDDQGVPMVLNNGEWVYNPVTIANFTLYHHTLYMRGQGLDPRFWAAVRKLQSMQAPDGAFRYNYAFSGMQPGWVSAMAQGQALSVFARAYLLSNDPAYILAGNASLRFLLTPVEEGGVRGDLRDLDPSLSDYVSLYEFDPTVSPHTLNGFIFTIFGLYDWAMLGRQAPANHVASTLAEAYFQCGAHTVASTVHYYDIGGFSAYDLRAVLGMGEPGAGPTYHRIHIAQLVALYSITRRPELLAWARTWAGSSQPVP